MAERRQPLTLRYPDKACARLKVWLVGDKRGRRRTSIETWAAVPNELAELVLALCYAILRPHQISPEVLTQAASLTKELRRDR